MAISTTTYEKEFFEKYTVESEKNDNEFLYEEKTGDSATGYVIGMKTTPHMCNTQYNFEKGVNDGWTAQNQIKSFTQENFEYDTDLLFPTSGCRNLSN